jgi:hypothetical protein
MITSIVYGEQVTWIIVILTYQYISLMSFSSVIEQLGGKHHVMQHLSHADPNVRYEALLAVQKLMVHNWLVLFQYISFHSYQCMIHRR